MYSCGVLDLKHGSASRPGFSNTFRSQGERMTIDFRITLRLMVGSSRVEKMSTAAA